MVAGSTRPMGDGGGVDVIDQLSDVNLAIYGDTFPFLTLFSDGRPPQECGAALASWLGFTP